MSAKFAYVCADVLVFYTEYGRLKRNKIYKTPIERNLADFERMFLSASKIEGLIQRMLVYVADCVQQPTVPISNITNRRAKEKQKLVFVCIERITTDFLK